MCYIHISALIAESLRRRGEQLLVAMPAYINAIVFFFCKHLINRLLIALSFDMLFDHCCSVVVVFFSAAQMLLAPSCRLLYSSYCECLCAF